MTDIATMLKAAQAKKISLRLKEDDIGLLIKYKSQITAFKKFCCKCGTDGFEEINFFDLGLGFFIALGVNGDSDTGEAFYDAHRLSSICRYTIQYWESEWVKTCNNS